MVSIMAKPLPKLMSSHHLDPIEQRSTGNQNQVKKKALQIIVCGVDTVSVQRRES